MRRRFTHTERFFSLFTILRPGEGYAAKRLCLQSFAIMFAYYLLKVIREPMILAEGSAELKTYSTAVQAVLLMLIVPVFAALYRRVRDSGEKHFLYRSTVLFFAVHLLLFAAAWGAGLPVAVTFYVWLGIASVMMLAVFWAFSADLFNLRSGQRIFPLIAAAGALGALVGSGISADVDRHIGHGGVMLVAAVLLLLAGGLADSTARLVPAGSAAISDTQPATSPAYPLAQGFLVVWNSATLRLIAALVILLNLINTNGEYILASFVTEYSGTLGRTEADQYLTVFYARYLFLTTALGFLIQLFLVSRIYKKVGIAGALYILPVLMIANYSLMALVPVLAVVRAAMMLENSVNYSLETTTRHALFLPVRREEKYVGKQTIDTFFFRLGDVLSGGFVFLASALVGLALQGFILINAVLAVALLLVSIGIGRRHKEDAARSLANHPPVATDQLDDMVIPAGSLTRLQLAEDTFIDPDVGDALRYSARCDDGERLPQWVTFDSLKRRFHFHPPDDSSGHLRIKVVARDFDGLEAEVSFNVIYGAGVSLASS
ncbi:ATP translocase [Parahaliea aestuarii]|uniref:ATP translocase n=1 Tax=Parahaliea aestuarii TaxID=1852021 RepID=A0A5C8ZQ28_9GAMM|nr:ATP translocase [Parahaliea aestuarii]TXS89750.1 ATP translocase [Parahaliea aestuarii]